MSQNEEDLPNGMNILALKPDNDKKTSNYDLYKKEGGENSATDMFQRYDFNAVKQQKIMERLQAASFHIESQNYE
jgi:hypothetical protein